MCVCVFAGEFQSNVKMIYLSTRSSSNRISHFELATFPLHPPHQPYKIGGNIIHTPNRPRVEVNISWSHHRIIIIIAGLELDTSRGKAFPSYGLFVIELVIIGVMVGPNRIIITVIHSIQCQLNAAKKEMHANTVR